jgi:hypothetical protein
MVNRHLPRPLVRAVAAFFALVIASPSLFSQPAFRIPITATDSSLCTSSVTAYVGFHPNASNCKDPDTLRGFSDHWSETFLFDTPYTSDALEMDAPPLPFCTDLVTASYTPAECLYPVMLNVHRYEGPSQVDSFAIRVRGLELSQQHALVWSVPSVIGEYCDSAVIAGSVNDTDQSGNPIPVAIRANLALTDGRYTSYPTNAGEVLSTLKLYIYHPKNPPPPPSHVQLVSPVDGATNRSVNSTLLWNAVPLAASYRYEIATDPGFGSVVTAGSVADTAVQLAGLLVQTTYYWRVAVVTPYGMSYYQSPSHFTTGDLVGVHGTRHELPSRFALLQNYPNPFNPSTKIEYALPNAVAVRLAVYDLFGQELQLLVDGEQEAGYNVVSFDASQLPSGVYFYRLTAGTATAVRKMLVTK